MREYVISDLKPAETQALEEALTARNLAAGIEHLYWLPVSELTAVQKEHAASCGPHVVALEVEETALRMELLIRAKNRLRCDCIAYADAGQTRALLASLHELLAELGIQC
ncbi:MAG TPA: hypothetical protein H9894_09645 [Candidatus Desulfovibrio intestinipullorum]|uniref:Uncharacterized protein n=1 Tax=Candidatus Desulfovibrio intestinipullorum TaxID=2838536 RepID=A0A9D1TQ67_9BACT|nr:hypothetical protein [Candidatus Desulfovibrio intestinipullorum]